MAVINPYVLRWLRSGHFRAGQAAKGRKEAAQSKKAMEDQIDIYDRDIKALESIPKKETLNQRLGREQKLRRLNKKRFDLIDEYQTEHAPKTEKLEFDPDEDFKTSDPSAKIDRPNEVLKEYEAQLNSGEIRRGANTELEMDRIQNELIQRGELSVEQVPSEELQSAFTHSQKATKAKGRQTRREEDRAYDESMGRVEPLPETSGMTLEELQRTSNRPITQKVEPGEASGLTRTESTDQIDVLGRNREAALRATIDELPPHLQTPENIRILAKEIIQEDVSDKAVGQVFGRSTEAHPKVRDPNIENFSIRQLEDIFIEGVDPKAKQHIPGVDMMEKGPSGKLEYKGDKNAPARRKALENVRREAAQAAEKSGRTKIIKDKFTGENKYIPKTHLGFIKDPKNIGNIRTNQQQLERRLGQSDQAPLEAVQEKLTGPLRPEVAEALELSKTKRGEKAGELRLDRQIREFLWPLLHHKKGKELPDPESVPTEKMIAEFLDEAAPQEPSLFGQLPYEFAPGTRTGGKAAVSKEAGKTRGDRLYKEFLKRKKREERDAYYEAQRAARRGQEKPPATQPEAPARSDIPSQQQPSTEQVLNMLLSRLDRSNVEPDAVRVAVQQLKLQGLDNLEIFEVLRRTIANGR
jgi:hypothetical protein